MDNSYMYKLRAGQFIYREGVRATPNIYLIMYGQFQCQRGTDESGLFGALMCIGHTLGEEVIFGPKKKVSQARERTESVVARVPSCVL